ncbi:MAG: DUF2127 domain-containing protein [Patescibacteria group bacterium]|nr:DUF2127 domain-containing protein [Patescibacteria group bacterium]
MNENPDKATGHIRAFFKDEKNIHRIFDVSLFIKGALALLEIIGGFLAYFVSQQALLDLAIFATRGELSEDPRDIVANYIVNSVQGLSIGTEHFIAWYLLGHGIVKLWLIIGLLSKKLWYYPVSIAVFGLFVLYQLYQFSLTNSAWLIVVTVLDIIVIWLTIHEYRYLKSLKKPRLVI